MAALLPSKRRSIAKQLRGSLLIAFLLATPSFLGGATAIAANGTWSGGAGGTWDASTTNWLNLSGIPWDVTNGGTNAAVFNTAGATPTVSGTVWANGITFSSAATISGGVINLAGTTPTITTTASGTISSVLDGSSGLTKAGAGTLVLSGSNSFSGGVTLTGGSLQVANVNALGTGTFTTNVDADTTISFNLPTSGTVANAISITKPGANRTYTFQQNQNNNVTLAGNITMGSGNRPSFNLATGMSSGTFTLTGSNSFGADVATGANVTIRVGGSNAAGGIIWRPASTLNLVLLDGANFRSAIGNGIASFGMETSGTATVSGDPFMSGTVAINTPAGAQLSFTGVVRGPSTLNKTGAGTWVLSNGFNDPNLTLNINQGTLQVANFNSLGFNGTLAQYLVLNGGTLQYTGGAASTARLFTLGANGGSLDASGSGAASFTSGSAVVFAGSGNRTLTLTGTNTGANTLALALNDNGADIVSLAKTGGGRWVLSGSNAYSGGTTLSAGQLNLNNANAIGTGTVTISSGTLDNSSGAAVTLATNNAQAWNGDFGFAGSNALNLGTGAVTLGASRQVTVTSSTLTVGGGIGDGGSAFALTKAGAGALVLSGSNSFSGGVTLTGGQLQIANANALGTGVFTTNVDADTTIPFNLPTSGTVANTITITKPGVNRTYTFQQNQAGNVTLAGNITVASGNGNRFQLATGVSSGTFTLTGSNAFGADVFTGANVTFRIGGTNAAGSTVWRPDATTSIVLLDGASFRTTVGNQIASYGMEASGTASVTSDVNAASSASIAINTPTGAQLSMTGVVRGGATYTKTGGGTWVVSNQFNDPNTTRILEGTVQVPVFSALGGSSGASYLVLNGGTLRYTGAAASTAKQFTLGANGGSFDASGSGSAAFTSTAAVAFAGSGNRTLTLTGTNTGNNTLAAAINDNGADKVSLSKTGAGRWTLTGSNAYSGNTTVSGGSLVVGNAVALGTGTATVGGGILDIGSYAPSVGGFVITSGSLTGSGTLASTSGYFLQGGAVSAVLGSGAITVSSGTTTLGSGGRFSSASGLTISSGRLALGGNESVASFSLTGGVLDGSAKTLTSTANYDFQSGSVLANLGGSAALVKSTSGTVTLSGSNSHSGGTQIAAGTLQLGSSTAMPASSALTLGTGSTSGVLAFNGNTATLGAITFNGSGSQLSGTASGGKLNLLASGTNNATITVNSGSHALHPDTTLQSNTVIDLAPGSYFSLHGVIDGSKSLTQIGSGTVSIYGANSYTGGTYLNSGYLSVQNTGALGSGTVTIDGNSILNLNNTILSNTVVFGSGSGAIINSGSLVNVTGTYSITSGTGTSITTNYSVQSGGNISFVSNLASTVSILGSAVGTFSSDVLEAGTVLVNAGGRGTFSGGMAGNVTTSGSALFSGDVLGNVTVSGGTATFTGATGAASAINVNSGLGVVTGTIGNTAHATAAGATLEIRGRVLSTADVNAEAGATVKLMGSQAFDGTTIDNDGSVIVDRTANLSLAAVISGTGSLTKTDATTLTLTGNNTFSGLTTISGGTLSVGDGGVSSGGALVGNVFNNAVLIFNRYADTTYAGNISGSGDFTKLGAGKLTLTGSSIYSGPTTVTDGVLAVNGQISSSVAVATGAVVGGSGVIGGTLSGEGLVSPGNSPGILSAGQYDATNGLDAAFEITGLAPDYSSPAASVNDVLYLTSGSPFVSSLTTSNVIDIYFDTAAQGTFDAGFFTTLSAENLLTAVQSATWHFWAKDAGGTQIYNGSNYKDLLTFAGITGASVTTAIRTVNFGSGNVTGSVTQFVIVPEPGAIAMAGIGIGLGGWSLWKRRRTVQK